MADGISAVKQQLVPGRADMAGTAGITMREIRPCPLVQIAAWPETLIQTGTEAARAIGAETPPGPGRATTGREATLLRVEPLKWWLIGARSLPSVETGAVLDLSHSRTWVHVSGPQATRLLSHVVPIDLSDGAFPVDAAASTAFHHVGVTLWRDAAGINLFLPRSFAASLCDILTESALQYGLEIV